MDSRKASASRASSAAFLLREGVAAETRRRVRMPWPAGVGQGPRSGAASAAAAHSSSSSAEGVAHLSSSSTPVGSAHSPSAEVPRIGLSSLRFGVRLLVGGRSRGGPPPLTAYRSSLERSALRLTTSLPSKPVRPAVLEGSVACWRILTTAQSSWSLIQCNPIRGVRVRSQNLWPQ
jgi:hypothetical protein